MINDIRLKKKLIIWHNICKTLTRTFLYMLVFNHKKK